MKCNHCGYEWDYKGEALVYTCCPRCKYNVRIAHQKIHVLLQCKQCGYSWYKRTNNPKRCPDCGSKKWNKSEEQ